MTSRKVRKNTTTLFDERNARDKVQPEKQIHKNESLEGHQSNAEKS